jgi:hypothetical protein
LTALLRRRGLQIVLAQKTEKALQIQKLRGIQVFYTASSKNIHFERSRYKFKTYMGMDGNEFISNEIEDSADHTLDAARYAIFTHFLRNNYFI